MCEVLESSYQQEWNSLFDANYYLENLRSIALKGKLRNCHFRSICWKVLLECLPEDLHSWIESTKLRRKQYEEILDKFHVNPRKLEQTMDISVNNPLSQSVQSPWNQYFQDSELKVTIQQDVVRTFPEVEFFHSQRIQEMMTNILFSYAREYPHISYKQGMHELLAPIIFVLHYDQQAYLEVSNTENLDLDIRIMLNQNYTEHDAFFLFCNLMEAVEIWYTMSESPYSRSLVSSEPFTEDASSPVNSLGLKLKNIYKNLLKHHDTELFLYLEQMEITPQIYGIRWLRLLFGREFLIQDLLIIWDAIFADSISFDLVDYIFVAMLIAIRDLLLKSDYASCLHHLMHYPNITDVQYIIDLALHLRDPGMPRPEICLVQDQMATKHVKERSTFVKTGFPKTLVSNQTKTSVTTKTTDVRPRSLKITNITSSIKNSPDQEARVEEPTEVFNYDNKGNYNTFPRSSIRNVMESKHMKFKALDVSQSFGHVEDKNITGKASLCREMVPLVPASQNSLNDNLLKKHKKITVKDKNEDIKSLKCEISEMKSMNDYCAKQITRHISKLQECMIGQQLLYEDEMFIALAGLKRARDILKGTVAFTEEVIHDDHISNFVTSSKKGISINDSVHDNVNCMHSDLDVSKNSELYKGKCSNVVLELEHQACKTHVTSTADCDKILNPIISKMNHGNINYNLNESVLKEQILLEQS